MKSQRMPKRLEQMGCGRHRLRIKGGEAETRILECVDPRCPFSAYPGQLFHEETLGWYDADPDARG